MSGEIPQVTEPLSQEVAQERCPICGHTWEVSLGTRDWTDAICPNCGALW